MGQAPTGKGPGNQPCAQLAIPRPPSVPAARPVDLHKTVQDMHQSIQDMHQLIQKEMGEMRQQIQSVHGDLVELVAGGSAPRRRNSTTSHDSAMTMPLKVLRSNPTSESSSRPRISRTEALEEARRAHTGFKVLAGKFPSWKESILKLEVLWDKLGQKNSPTAPRCCNSISKLDDWWSFHVFMAAVVIVNCICLAVEANLSVEEPGQRATTGLLCANVFFLFAYTFELIVKLMRHGPAFFYSENYALNWLDAFLLIFGILDILIFEVVMTVVPDLSGLRSLRGIRLAKIFRMVKILSEFQELRAVLTSLAAAGGTMFSSSVIIFVTLFMTSLLIVTGVGWHLSDRGGDDPNVEIDATLLESFGSVGHAMLSLLACCFGGDDWVVYVRPLEALGWTYPTVLVILVLFVQLALLSIITGIFVDKAMRCLGVDHHGLIREHAIGELEKKNALEGVFRDAGLKVCELGAKITQCEWESMMESPHLIAYFDFIGCTPDAANNMFYAFMSESSDQAVDAGMFIKALCGMNRAAGSFSIMRRG